MSMDKPNLGDAAVRASAEGQKKPSEIVFEKLKDAASNMGSLAAERVLARPADDFRHSSPGLQESQAEAERAKAGESISYAELRLSQAFAAWNERVPSEGFEAGKIMEHLKKQGKTPDAPIAFDLESPYVKGSLNAGEPIKTMRVVEAGASGEIMSMDPESRISILISLGVISPGEANLAADKPPMTEKEFDRLIIGKAEAYSQGKKLNENNYDVRLPIGDPKLLGFAVRLFKGRLRELGIVDREDMNAGVVGRGIVLDFEQAFKKAKGVEN